MDPTHGANAELDIRRRARNDLIAIGIGSVVAFVLLSSTNAFESFSSWSRSHESMQLDEVLIFGVVLAVGLAIFALRRWRDLVRAEALRRAAEHSARRLEGLLPICSGCKRIREQAGEWTPVEEYFSARVAADFTHGLCPECRVRLYPNLPS
jgi:hypothetical protein